MALLNYSIITSKPALTRSSCSMESFSNRCVSRSPVGVPASISQTASSLSLWCWENDRHDQCNLVIGSWSHFCVCHFLPHAGYWWRYICLSLASKGVGSLFHPPSICLNSSIHLCLLLEWLWCCIVTQEPLFLFLEEKEVFKSPNEICLKLGTIVISFILLWQY